MLIINRVQQYNQQHKQIQAQKKIAQREELRKEMARVLEMKRQQKLNAQEQELKYII